MNKLLKLNLGCGTDKRKGYINIDADPKVKPDLVHNLTQKLPYPQNFVSEIIMQDVLEHLTKEEAVLLLKECGRVLISSGKITIRVPDIPAILKKFKKRDDLIMLYLYGDTSQGGTYGSHKYGYTPGLIKESCQKAGFKIAKIKKVDINLLISGHKNEIYPKQIICDNLFSFIFLTPILTAENKKVVWIIKKSYPPILGKTVLRYLSKEVLEIRCSKNSQDFVKNVLHYSHLRTVIEDI